MNPADRQAIDNLSSAIAQIAPDLRAISNFLKSQTTSCLGKDELVAKFRRPWKQIRQVLIELELYDGKRGRPVRVPVSAVAELDRVLNSG